MQQRDVILGKVTECCGKRNSTLDLKRKSIAESLSMHFEKTVSVAIYEQNDQIKTGDYLEPYFDEKVLKWRVKVWFEDAPKFHDLQRIKKSSEYGYSQTNNPPQYKSEQERAPDNKYNKNNQNNYQRTVTYERRR